MFYLWWLLNNLYPFEYVWYIHILSNIDFYGDFLMSIHLFWKCYQIFLVWRILFSRNRIYKNRIYIWPKKKRTDSIFCKKIKKFFMMLIFLLKLSMYFFIYIVPRCEVDPWLNFFFSLHSLVFVISKKNISCFFFISWTMFILYRPLHAIYNSEYFLQKKRYFHLTTILIPWL